LARGRTSLEGGESALPNQQGASGWDRFAGDSDPGGSRSQFGSHSDRGIVGNFVVDEEAAAGQLDPPDARSFVLLPQRRQSGMIADEQLRHRQLRELQDFARLHRSCPPREGDCFPPSE
jgi:hypothetical protein